MLRKRILSISIVSLFALVALAACGQPDESVQPTATRIPDVVNAPVLTPTPEAQATSESGSPVSEGETGSPEAGSGEAAGASNGVTIKLEDIYFDPDTVNIASGAPVTFTLENVGATDHNFSIDALDISVDVAPGETKTVDINADPGDYEFYCDVPGHKEAGMVGTLTVT